MNVSEANDTQKALEFLLMLDRGDGCDAHQMNLARTAAANLADRSSQRLGAGLRGRDVLQALPEYCADRFEDDEDPEAGGGPVVRYCYRPAGHPDEHPDGAGWHDDICAVWPVEPAGGDHR